MIDPDRWDFDAGHDTVTIRETEPMHEYTVSFLAYIIWDRSRCTTI